MRWIRFAIGEEVHWGRLQGDDHVVPLGSPPWEWQRGKGEAPIALAGVRLLAPVRPGKIIGVGKNYVAHAREMGGEVPKEPLIFLKAPSAVVGPGEAIEVPADVGEVHHEAEVGVVIGRRLRGVVTPDEVRAAIFGLTCLNDVTARAIQRSDKLFARAKGFDTFCPVGPWITDGLDPDAPRSVVCRVDGGTRQSGNTGDMAFLPTAIVAYVARGMTLDPGDVIATGTPEGVGPILPGQRVEIEVEGVGVLENPVTAREA